MSHGAAITQLDLGVPVDAQAMADALEKLIKNEQKARVMAAAAQVMVTRDYSLAAMAERLKTALAYLI